MASTSPTLRGTASASRLISFPKPHPHFANSLFLGYLHKERGLCHTKHSSKHRDLCLAVHTREILNALTRTPYFQCVLSPPPPNYVVAPGPFIKFSSSVPSVSCQKPDPVPSYAQRRAARHNWSPQKEASHFPKRTESSGKRQKTLVFLRG